MGAGMPASGRHYQGSAIAEGPGVRAVVAALGADLAEGLQEGLLRSRRVPVGAGGQADAAAQGAAGQAQFGQMNFDQIEEYQDVAKTVAA